MQNRRGAPVFQPYLDLWKLFHKDEVLSGDASFVFLIAPYIVFAVTVVVGASIPLLSYLSANEFTSDVLVVIYLIALGTFFLALAGMDVGGAFGGFGASREMFVSALVEGVLLFSLLTPVLLSKTTNLFLISKNISSLSVADYLPVLVAFFAFFVSMLAEACRYPFDNPATHLELTMIHEAMIIEYSGKRLALMEWASANKYMIFSSLAAGLFFPWGISGSLEFYSVFASFLSFFFKALILATSVAIIESVIAKKRLFKLPKLLLTSFVLSFAAIILTF